MTDKPKTRRPMREHIADIYRPSANVTIADASAPAVTTTRKRSLLDELAGCTASEAATMREWATRLDGAIATQDWDRARLVATELRKTADGLDELVAKAREQKRRVDAAIGG